MPAPTSESWGDLHRRGLRESISSLADDTEIAISRVGVIPPAQKRSPRVRAGVLSASWPWISREGKRNSR